MTQNSILRIGVGGCGRTLQEHRTKAPAMPLEHANRLPFRWLPRSKGCFFHLHAFLLAWCTGDVSQSPTRCRARRPPSAIGPSPAPLGPLPADIGNSRPPGSPSRARREIRNPESLLSFHISGMRCMPQRHPRQGNSTRSDARPHPKQIPRQ